MPGMPGKIIGMSFSSMQELSICCKFATCWRRRRTDSFLC